MNPKEREGVVDSVLDRALGPQLVEPRAGLEERILANVASQSQRHRWWHWMWVPALAAAAVLAMVVGMRVMHRETPAPQVVKKTVETPKQEIAVKPASPNMPNFKKAQPPVIAKRIAPRILQESAPQQTVASRALPRMDVFPAPTPLSDQERLLLALSRRQQGEVEIAANSQSSERERAQKYFDTGYAPGSEPTTLNKR